MHINTGALSSSITGKYCTANMVHGPLDTYAMSHSTATALTKDGAGTWYFLTADYAFGHAIQDDTTALLKAAGGQVLGSAAYPFPGTVDFSAFLLQAQASGGQGDGARGLGRRCRELPQAGEGVRHRPVHEDRGPSARSCPT